MSPPWADRRPLLIPEPASGPRLDFSFAARLNEQASTRLGAGVAAARRSRNNSPSSSGRLSASRVSAILQVGDTLTLNVSSRACDSVVNHVGRVVAVGSQSIVVADTLNPAGGFTAADYQRFAARFDTAPRVATRLSAVLISSVSAA